jgi:hypothetical protein
VGIIKMDPVKIGFGDVSWMELAQSCVQWRVIVLVS